MIGNYYEKADIVDVSTQDMVVYTPEVVQKLMNGANDCKSLIKNIEKYNDDNKLPYEKRIMYSVAVGINYIAVFKAYEVGGNHMAIVGWDKNGYPGQEYDKDGKLISARASLSTHLVPVSAIYDVQIGSYDKSKVGQVFELNMTDNINEEELTKTIDQIISDVRGYYTSGSYRTAINRFNYLWKSKHINDYTYKHMRTAYDAYLRAFDLYISMVYEIVVDGKQNGRVTYDFDHPRQTPFNKFEFVDNLNDIDKYVMLRHLDHYESEYYKANFEVWKTELLERVFTKQELRDFEKIIKWDKIFVGADGKLRWKA